MSTAFQVFMKKTTAELKGDNAYARALDKWRLLKCSFQKDAEAALRAKYPSAKARVINRECKIKWFAYCQALINKRPYVDPGEFM